MLFFNPEKNCCNDYVYCTPSRSQELLQRLQRTAISAISWSRWLDRDGVAYWHNIFKWYKKHYSHEIWFEMNFDQIFMVLKNDKFFKRYSNEQQRAILKNYLSKFAGQPHNHATVLFFGAIIMYIVMYSAQLHITQSGKSAFPFKLFNGYCIH